MKKILLFFLLIIGLFIFTEKTKAILSVVDEYFDDYLIDELNGQKNWTAWNIGNHVIITNEWNGDLGFLGGIKRSIRNGGGSAYKHYSATTSSKTIIFEMAFGTTTSLSDDFYFILNDQYFETSSVDSCNMVARIYRPTDKNYVFYGFYYLSADHWIGTTSINTLESYRVRIQNLENTSRMDFNFLGWSDYYQFNRIATTNLEYVYLKETGYRIYLDSLFIGGDLGIVPCGNNYQCSFCLTPEECENFRCYWNTTSIEENLGVCLEKNAIIQKNKFQTFYNNIQSRWSTPTSIIGFMASTTEPIFLTISSAIGGFTDKFNLDQGASTGLRLGSVVPTLRGYMMFLNYLFADLPISEMIILWICVMIGIGIIKMIKP